MSYLALVRHGESEWNAKGLWTGWKDIPLTQKGIEQAKTAGVSLKDIKFGLGFTSILSRVKQTMDEMKKVLNQQFPVVEDKALNERNYGVYTGKNKWEIKKEVGEEEFLKIRRGWDHPIPEGECLKDVYQRAIPYYEKNILPKLKEGKNVLVSASSNSLRALVKYLENIPDDKISKLELAIGEVYLYTIGNNGKVVSKEIRASGSGIP
ncbi:MAG: 2,3-diphosphoglycerate-dependent phosphoglycerate mutase [Candidatus Levybacteria bacterium]|nr:2,3-diphosphoglycerate-dependent phosphoglycerate mutase [Candidatus Levybacteria bacterium]